MQSYNNLSIVCITCTEYFSNVDYPFFKKNKFVNFKNRIHGHVNILYLKNGLDLSLVEISEVSYRHSFRVTNNAITPLII